MAGPGAPFACNVHGFTPAARAEHRVLADRLAESVLAAAELADGYEFTLDHTRFSPTDLVAWLALERQCCPFFDIGFEWRRNGGPLVLQLKGRDGVLSTLKSQASRIS